MIGAAVLLADEVRYMIGRLMLAAYWLVVA